MSYYNYYPNYYAPNVQYAVAQQPMMSPMQQQVMAQQQQLVQQQQQQASIAQQQAAMAQQAMAQQVMAQQQPQMAMQQQPAVVYQAQAPAVVTQQPSSQAPMMQPAVVYQAQATTPIVSQHSSQHPYPVLPNYSGQTNYIGAKAEVPASPIVGDRHWATTAEKFTLKEGKQEIHCVDPLHDVEAKIDQATEMQLQQVPQLAVSGGADDHQVQAQLGQVVQVQQPEPQVVQQQQVAQLQQQGVQQVIQHFDQPQLPLQVASPQPPMMHPQQSPVVAAVAPPVHMHNVPVGNKGIKSNLLKKLEESDSVISFEDLKIEKEIARGSFGIVYRGLFRGTEVAVKKLLVQNLNSRQFEDFLQEIMLMKKLRHPNILLYMGVCTAMPNLCIVTEFMNRGSLWDVLHNYQIPLDWRLIFKMAIDAAKGMTYLHGDKPPIIHRDLKSGNILIDSSFTAKIADFGLSKIKDITNQMTGQTGTPGYMAPEVINSQKYTEKVDVYSFGVILWELITRQAPYAGIKPLQVLFAVVQGSRPQIPYNCPPGLSQLITSCWHHNPDRRPHFVDIITILKSLEASLVR
eukprot:TRINITY_DN2796_c0_g2_i2.p1 TRINITY_DN2796_c0_g2~~TRINITY_DN2796_c0_g2_i2.p1  ORF type:complete len:572 (-),score=128.79 TRINITY_DN2796_c0_g2_i2:239-1954(-)